MKIDQRRLRLIHNLTKQSDEALRNSYRIFSALSSVQETPAPVVEKPSQASMPSRRFLIENAQGLQAKDWAIKFILGRGAADLDALTNDFLVHDLYDSNSVEQSRICIASTLGKLSKKGLVQKDSSGTYRPTDLLLKKYEKGKLNGIDRKRKVYRKYGRQHLPEPIMDFAEKRGKPFHYTRDIPSMMEHDYLGQVLSAWDDDESLGKAISSCLSGLCKAGKMVRIGHGHYVAKSACRQTATQTHMGFEI